MVKKLRTLLFREEEKRAVSKVEAAYGNSYDYNTMHEAKNQVANLLGEESIDVKPRSVLRGLQQTQKEVQERELPQRKRSRDLDR